MAPCCFGRQATVRNFTVLFIHVLHVSHPAALEGSTRYAREIVDTLVSTTNLDFLHRVSHLDLRYHKAIVKSHIGGLPGWGEVLV